MDLPFHLFAKKGRVSLTMDANTFRVCCYLITSIQCIVLLLLISQTLSALTRLAFQFPNCASSVADMLP